MKEIKLDHIFVFMLFSYYLIVGTLFEHIYFKIVELLS